MSGWLHIFLSIGRRILQLGLVVALADLVAPGLRLFFARLREWSNGNGIRIIIYIFIRHERQQLKIQNGKKLN